jgi:putative ABC transport system permease protein
MTRFYRAALRVLPREVRDRHGAEMAAVFDQQVGEAGRSGRRAAVPRLLVKELAALVRFAWRERRAAPPPRRVDDRSLSWPEGRAPMFASIVQDLRYAVRMLATSPGFTLVSVVTMALAIGANTAIFSVVNGVLLQPLPFHDPGRVVIFGQRTDSGQALNSTSPGNIYDFMSGATAFESMAGFAPTERIVTWNGTAERIRGGLSVGNIFDVLGRQPAEGRALALTDDDPGASPVVVLSTGLARRLFGSASPIGQPLTINATPHTIVGVMPPDFAFLDYDYEYWLPARFDAAFQNNRDQYFLLGLARLRPDTTTDQAQAQLNTIMDAVRREYPQYTENATAGVVSAKEILLDGVETRMLLLMGAVAFVLLVACANLGNLQLARASTRRQEVAVRQALGARPGRLVRQFLTESVLLAVIGGLAGVVLGSALLGVLLTSLPDDLPRLKGVELDATVLGFTAGLAILAGLLFGAFPALQLLGPAPSDGVREGARGSRSHRRLRSVLVASELALALILLVGAGLLTQSFARLSTVPPGFQAERLLTFVATTPPTYRSGAERSALFERLAGELEALPGVADVTLTTTLPVAGRGTGAWFNIIDRPLPANETPPAVPYRIVRWNYFKALGVRVLRGRDFTADDRLGRSSSVVVSESVARRFWPNEDPLGRRIYLGAPDNRIVQDAEIVGIVADVKQAGLDEDRSEAVYIPHGAVAPWLTSLTFAVRTSTDPAAMASAVREQVKRIDPSIPIVRMSTMDDVIARATAPARSSMMLMGLFAVVALLLGIVGVFSVLSYTVTQQTTEIGIRMALGATGRNVTLLVLAQGMAPVAVGVLLGWAGALALTRFMDTLLFGITPTDPATFATVSALLAAVAAIASYIPARRATRVDPVRALRRE